MATGHDVGHIASILPVAEFASAENRLGAWGVGDEVDPAEQVDEMVARHAGTNLLESPPLEKHLGVEGQLFRHLDELIPIGCFRAGIGWDGVLPGAEGALPVLHGIDHVELPNLPFYQ